MTPKKKELLESDLKPCRCGGQLYISTSKREPRRGLAHFTIKCKKCGAWHGGFTNKKV